jgi:ABC-2 type transport system ATP-binding protein
MSEFAVHIDRVSKAFAGMNALNEVSLSVKKGEIMGLIGPDGAGKSTLFRILTTLMLADKGSVQVLGHDVVHDYRTLRNMMGYMPGRFSLYQDLTVQENLQFFATIFGTTISENYHLIREIYVQLEPFKDRPAGKLSGGMKQKLALCCALVHKPSILFLDEPTTGVDPVSRQEFWQMLKRLHQEEITILVSTPYMDEAAQCDRVAMMQHGNILQVASPSEVQHAYRGMIYEVKGQEMYKMLVFLRQQQAITSCYSFGEQLHVTIEDDQYTEVELDALLSKAGFQASIKRGKAGIEDVFMQELNQPLPTT